jgi:hypothetical protein
MASGKFGSFRWPFEWRDELKAKTVLLLILAILAAVPVLAGGWLVYYDGPYTGKVIDAETGQPIEGAAVLGIWRLEVYGGMEVQLKYLGAREAVTDKDGYFDVPKVVGFYWWPLARLGKPRFTIFKPGYDSYPPSLPIITPLFTEEDYQRRLEYQIKYLTEINTRQINIIRLNTSDGQQERKWVVTNITLVSIQDNERYKRAKNMINAINLERLKFGLQPIYVE